MELELADARLARPRDRLRRGASFPTPRRRWLSATISPRSATCRLAGCGSRESESRATIRPSSSATNTAASGWRWIVRRYRRSSATERHGPVPRIQRPSSRPTLSASSTSAWASPGVRAPDDRSFDDDPDAATPWVARGLEESVRRALDRLDAAEEEVQRVPAVRRPSRGKRGDVARPASLPRGGASCRRRAGAARGSRRATCMPRRIRHVTWAIAPASRTDPALPMTSSRPARRRARASGSSCSRDARPAPSRPGR